MYELRDEQARNYIDYIDPKNELTWDVRELAREAFQVGWESHKQEVYRRWIINDR